MYKGIDDNLIFKKDVVIDTSNRYWWVEDFIHDIGEEPKAKIRNGCSFTFYYVKDLRVCK